MAFVFLWTLTAMAIIATQVVRLTADLTLSDTDAAASGGDKFTPGDNVLIRIKNTDTGSHTVTIDSKVPSNYGTDVNIAVTLAAGDIVWRGPFPAQRFMGSDGYADIAYGGDSTGIKIVVMTH